jgi:hypothetical protein
VRLWVVFEGGVGAHCVAPRLAIKGAPASRRRGWGVGWVVVFAAISPLTASLARRQGMRPAGQAGEMPAPGDARQHRCGGRSWDAPLVVVRRWLGVRWSSLRLRRERGSAPVPSVVAYAQFRQGAWGVAGVERGDPRQARVRVWGCSWVPSTVTYPKFRHDGGAAPVPSVGVVLLAARLASGVGCAGGEQGPPGGPRRGDATRAWPRVVLCWAGCRSGFAYWRRVLRRGRWSGSIHLGGRNSGTPEVGLIETCQSELCRMRWCLRHSRTRLVRSVGPPWSQCRTWCASHQEGQYH